MSAPTLDVAAVVRDLRDGEACLASGDSRGATLAVQRALAAVVSHTNRRPMTVWWSPTARMPLDDATLADLRADLALDRAEAEGEG